MAKLVTLLSLLAIFVFFFASTSNATTYVVGDTSGWDISTNLDSWASDKRFTVGDALVFQYSSSHSVDEVSRENFETCNTTNVIGTFTNGNTTVTLSKPGSRYFVCGNQLHCLGGMKLQANVQGDQAASPAATPQAEPGVTLPQPSSKSNKNIPTSNGIVHGGRECLAVVFIGLMATVLPRM